MVESKEWTNIDPKNAKILALITHQSKLNKFKTSAQQQD